MNEHKASTVPPLHLKPGSRVRDALIAGLAFLLIFLVFVYADFVELIFTHSRRHEAWQLDEILASIPALALVTAWFSYRRWRQVSTLNQQLREALDEVQAAQAQRQRLQTQLRDAQRMEALGRLAGGIAHELNNVLQPIMTLAQLNLKRDGLPERTRTGLEKIKLAAEQGREIVRKTLVYASGGSGERVWIPLAAALSETLDFLQETFSSEIEIVSEIDQDQGLARLDRTELMQVMTNLLNNAADAMAHKGRIYVSMRQNTVTDHEAAPLDLSAGDYFCVTVSDGGCGMTGEVGVLAFDPFFTTKGPESGTGLGLAVVHGLVTDWGGKITVDSKPGTGASFRILIPRHLPAPT